MRYGHGLRQVNCWRPQRQPNRKLYFYRFYREGRVKLILFSNFLLSTFGCGCRCNGPVFIVCKIHYRMIVYRNIVLGYWVKRNPTGRHAFREGSSPPRSCLDCVRARAPVVHGIDIRVEGDFTLACKQNDPVAMASNFGRRICM